MKKIMLGAVGVIVASTSLFTQSASAWHPVGVISKQVQNVTSNGEVSDADTATTAVEVKTGDLLRYYITVRNDGAADANGWNDMAGTKVTDTLPEGVELIANRDQRTITVDLGTIKPGEEVTKIYDVKVTSTVNKQVITNKACFTGDSAVNDNKQEGCDDAVVKTNIPQTSSTSTTTPSTPVATPKPQPAVQSAATVKTLPKTGAADAIKFAAAAAMVGIVVAQVRLRRAQRV